MISRYSNRVRLVVPHVLLYSATILYSIFGAVVFHLVELPFETEHLQQHSAAITEAEVKYANYCVNNGIVILSLIECIN